MKNNLCSWHEQKMSSSWKWWSFKKQFEAKQCFHEISAFIKKLASKLNYCSTTAQGMSSSFRHDFGTTAQLLLIIGNSIDKLLSVNYTRCKRVSLSSSLESWKESSSFHENKFLLIGGDLNG